jgi:hypothetical protein
MDIRYDPKEIEFFEMRHPSRVYISKLTEFKNSVTGEVTSKRTIRKVFEKSEDVQVVNVHGEYVLRSSPAGRDQVRVVVHDNDNSRMSLTIQKFGLYGHRPTQFVNFTFRDDEFAELLEFLRMLRFLDLSKTDNTRT